MANIKSFNEYLSEIATVETSTETSESVATVSDETSKEMSRVLKSFANSIISLCKRDPSKKKEAENLSKLIAAGKESEALGVISKLI